MLELNQEQIHQVVGGVDADDGADFSLIPMLGAIGTVGGVIMGLPEKTYVSPIHMDWRMVVFGAAAGVCYGTAVLVADFFDKIWFPYPSVCLAESYVRKVA